MLAQLKSVDYVDGKLWIAVITNLLFINAVSCKLIIMWLKGTLYNEVGIALQTSYTQSIFIIFY